LKREFWQLKKEMAIAQISLKYVYWLAGLISMDLSEE
jgi:hypothetical protein